jgi:hypothetical protein
MLQLQKEIFSEIELKPSDAWGKIASINVTKEMIYFMYTTTAVVMLEVLIFLGRSSSPVRIRGYAPSWNNGMMGKIVAPVK